MSNSRKKLSADYNPPDAISIDGYFYVPNGDHVLFSTDLIRHARCKSTPRVQYPIVAKDGAEEYSSVVDKEFTVNPASSHPISRFIILLHQDSSTILPPLQINFAFKDAELAKKCRNVFEINKIAMMEITKPEVFRFSDYSEFKRALEFLATGKVLTSEDTQMYLDSAEEFLSNRGVLKSPGLVK